MAAGSEPPKVAGGPDQEQTAVVAGAPGSSKPVTAPQVQQTLPPVPRTEAGHAYLGPSCCSQRPSSLSAAATCPEGSGSWGQGSGTICRHAPSLLSCSKSCSGGRVSPSLLVFHYVTLSPSLSISPSFPPWSAVQPALLPSLPTPVPAPRRRRSPRGLRGLGAVTSAWGEGCAECRLPRGRQGTGVYLGCAVTSVGPQLGHLSGPGCLLSLAVPAPALSALGRKPRPDPDLVTDLPSLSPCAPSTKPVFSARNGCRRGKTRQARMSQTPQSSPFSPTPVYTLASLTPDPRLRTRSGVSPEAPHSTTTAQPLGRSGEECCLKSSRKHSQTG